MKCQKFAAEQNDFAVKKPKLCSEPQNLAVKKKKFAVKKVFHCKLFFFTAKSLCNGGGDSVSYGGGEGGKEGAAGSTYVRVTGSTRWVDELEKMGRLAKTGKGEGGAGKWGGEGGKGAG